MNASTAWPALLLRAREAGLVSALALALLRWLERLDPAAPRSLLAAALLLTELEARGHTVLPLARLDEVLDELWPVSAAPGVPDALRAAWRSALRRQGLDQVAERGLDWAATPLLAQVSHTTRGDALRGVSPLVLDQGRLAWRRAWADEQRAAARLVARASMRQPLPAAAEAGLDWLFPPEPGGDGLQREAVARALQGRLLVLTGGPGTGKTWTAARLLVLQQALHATSEPTKPLAVALAAPTGKAAARLKQSLSQALATLPPPTTAVAAALPGLDAARAAAAAAPARTLHAWLGTRPGTRRFVHGPERLLPLDLVVVDEASMLHTELLAALLDALPATASLVLLGDRDQLASVEAGAVMAELGRGTGALAGRTVALSAGRRFDGAIARLAAAVNAGDVQAVKTQWAEPDEAVVMRSEARPAALAALVQDSDGSGGYGGFVSALAQPGPAEQRAARVLAAFETFRVLCALREGPQGVAGLNAQIEQTLGLAPTEPGGWYDGRPVMVTRNDAALGVFNGDVGVALRGEDGGPLRVWFASGSGDGNGAALRSVAAARLPTVETAFAMTVHKSQGSEFRHVALVLPAEDSPVLTREWLYTGITRARERLTLWCPAPTVLAAAVARRTRRFSGLAAAVEARAAGAEEA